MRRAGMVILIVLGLLGIVSRVKAVDDKTIISCFQDAVNKVMYPLETNISNLTDKQIARYIIPNAASILADTIRNVYQKKHEDIGIEAVLAVLPPKLEKVFRKDENKLKKEVMSILEGKAKNQ